MVHKYRKRPTIISAMEFSRTTWEELREFTNGQAEKLITPKCPNCKSTCSITTLEGVMTATEGDYIIKGIQGEFYPYKHDIFNETYEYVAPGEL